MSAPQEAKEACSALDLSTSPQSSPGQQDGPTNSTTGCSDYDPAGEGSEVDIQSLTAKVNPIMGNYPDTSSPDEKMAHIPAFTPPTKSPRMPSNPFEMPPSVYPAMLQQAQLAAAVFNMPLRNSLGGVFPGMFDSRPANYTPPVPPPTQTSLSSLLNGNKRKRVAPQKKTSSEGDSSPSEKKATVVPEEKKDAAYWERRKKNNEAAKRSRDSRRRKEDEVTAKAMQLEGENLQLKTEVSVLKSQLSEMQYMLMSKGTGKG